MHYAVNVLRVASADALRSHTSHKDVSVPNNVVVFCMNANIQSAGCTSY